MANISNFISPVGGGGGGGLSEVASFTEDTVWPVPASIQAQISSQGYATIGLFMVGGGSQSGAGFGGEIVNQTIRITADDYDAGSAGSPTITIQVGGQNEASGITRGAPATPTFIFDTGAISVANPGSGGNVHDVIAQGHRTDANGRPIIAPAGITLPGVTGGLLGNTVVNPASITWTGSGTFTYDGANGGTFAAEQPFDGMFLAQYPAVRGIQLELSWEEAAPNANQVEFVRTFATTGNIGNAATTGGAMITLFAIGDIQRIARPGGSPEANQFLNNNQSTEGYFGGFARRGGRRPNSGQAVAGTGQSGFVQIFY